MRELCVPIPGFNSDQSAEIKLKIGKEKISYDFKVVSFPWDIEDELSVERDELSKSLARITRLKTAINDYSQEWELIQIFNPAEDASFIQVLYRKKMK
ncbi:MAG: hypothetical protein J7K53_10325 [Bacteroidales bacterium]|nr:hypothetical protein [Bacteroidales bacterium]